LALPGSAWRGQFTDLAKGIERDRDNVLMSLGWLAREGHVILIKIDGNYRISLRKDV